MRRSSLIILTVAIVCCTAISVESTSTTTSPSTSPSQPSFVKHNRAPQFHSKLQSKFIKVRQAPPGTYEASPGDYPQIDGSDGTANNLTLLSAFKHGSTFFPLAMIACVSTGILVCFFLISIGKACAHRKKFADALDYPDGMPEIKKEPITTNNISAPEARRDWEWDQKDSRDKYENQSTTRLVDDPSRDRVLSIHSSATGSEYGMPQVPARSHRGGGGGSSSGGGGNGAKNARSINSSNNKSRQPQISTGAHPLSNHQTMESYSEEDSQRSSLYSRGSRSSSVDSYDDFGPRSPRSPNNEPPSPRSPNNNNTQPPRSILGGGAAITQPRPLYVNPSPSAFNNGVGSPSKLPSPGSNAGSPTFMSHLQNTQPLSYTNTPTTPTTPFTNSAAPPHLPPHLRFAPISLDAPPKKNKRFSAISTPLSNRFSLASSNWSFAAPPSPPQVPGPIEQSLMNEQEQSEFQQQQQQQTQVSTDLPYNLGPSSLTDYPPKSPLLTSPKALAYIERPRTDSIGGFSGISGGRKSKRDVVSGVYSGYTPFTFAPSVKSPKFPLKK